MAVGSGQPRNAPRGPAAGRRRAAARTDRDGDLKMDVTVKGRASRGGISKSTPPPGSRGGDLMSRTSTRTNPRSALASGSTRGAILRRAAGSGDVNMGDTRSPNNTRTGSLVELKVTGWRNSKASDSADGGASSLINWIEKKASNRLTSRARSVKVKKSRVEDKDTLIISVPGQDIDAITRMNGYGWAGTTVKIERIGGTRGASAPSKETEDLKAMFRGILEARYNFETKLLDLSNLADDPVLRQKKVFEESSTTAKFFPALMSVLSKSFDTTEELDAAITSVSLANNGLTDLSHVSNLSFTLKKLQNLDLSNNSFANLEALGLWKKRFLYLQHLILSGNPLEQNQPDYPKEIVSWYPNLRMLNNVQVRTEEEIANKSKNIALPFPIRTALFQDEGGIAENFVRTFFTGFDTDRARLAELYYDGTSDFSFSVNTQAPRDPNSTQHTEKQEWGDYIKNSRNLKKISHLPARQNRLFRGTKAVTDAFTTLPKTQHPNLETEARKWMIEAHIQPGVPDPSGQSAGGVDGFMITVHGEFDEVDAGKKKRSFDRTFIIGPGGPSGVRIVNDMLTVRAYGGTQAFEPESFEAWNTQNDAAQQQQQQAAVDASLNAAAAPQLPPNVSVEVAEQMVVELQKQTGMTLQYSKDCLEQVGWDFQKAVEAFASVKANLPAEAFAA